MRANFVAWTASASEAFAKDLRSAARNAAVNRLAFADPAAAPDPVAAYAANAAGFAAAAVADDAATDYGNGAAAAAANAAAKAAAKAGEFGLALTADADWLMSHPSDSGAGLTGQLLWLIDVRGNPELIANFPMWARQPFDAFDRSEWAVKGPWSVWLAWYREILPSHKGPPRLRQFNHSVAYKIARQPPAFWERNPHRVTAVIAEMVGHKWPESEWKWPAEDDSDAPQPARKKKASKKSSAPTDSPEPDPQPLAPIETVGIHSDEPTDEDQLGRWPFAKALAEHMDDVYWQQKAKAASTGSDPDDGDGFAMHIHAPWGAGKTSVIKMMRKMLERNDRSSKNGRTAPQWIVVEFNAWRNERRNPPWWPLTEEIYAACSRGLRNGGFSQRFLDRSELRLWWLWWKTCTVWLPYAIAGLVLIAASYFVWRNWGIQGVQDNLKNLLSVITALGAVVVTFVGVSRFAVFGSTANAKVFEDLSQDPMKRLARQFKRIVETANKPICVVIDDLDRCQPAYVVALLQGVQTIFRHRNVAYLVAADRTWVKTSFEHQYKDFKDTVGSATQPLGYLFLEKVFQVSTPLPAVSAKMRAAYWNRLLQSKASPADGDKAVAPPVSPISEQAVEDVRKTIRNENDNLTRKDAEQFIAKAGDTPTVRAALALELSTSAGVARDAAHLLKEFESCVPEIPRMMKRMLNAYAIRQAMGVLIHEEVPVKALARWTIIEQSEPALADALVANPGLVEAKASIPKDHPLAELLKSARFAAIARGGNEPLTPAHVRKITRGEEVVFDAPKLA